MGDIDTEGRPEGGYTAEWARSELNQSQIDGKYNEANTFYHVIDISDCQVYQGLTPNY